MSSIALAVGVTSVAVSASLFPPLPAPLAPARVRTGPVFNDVVEVLREKTNYEALAQQLHSSGVSVYYSPTSPEVKFSQNEVRKLAFDTTKRNFGTAPGSGMALEMTGDQFFFGRRGEAVAKGVGPLPDWAKIAASTSSKAFGKAQVTTWESTTHIPSKWSKHPFWSIAYKGDEKVSNFDAAEVRVVFDVDGKVKGKPYRVVALVLAAPYSP